MLNFHLLTQLVRTYVRYLLCRGQFRVRTSLDIVLGDRTLQDREGRIIYKFSLFDDSEMEVHSVEPLDQLSPVEKVVVINDPAAEIALADHGNMLWVVLVFMRVYKTITQAGFPNAKVSSCFRGSRHSNHHHPKYTLCLVVSHF